MRRLSLSRWRTRRHLLLVHKRTRKRRLPVEFFTKYDEFGGVKISPDGQFIAVLTGKYGSSTLLFTDLKPRRTSAASARRRTA
jgi:hypothetical protein